MSTPSGSNMTSSLLHGVVWPLEADPTIGSQIEQYNGRDNHIGLIWLDDEQAELRVYDEYTKGGRRLVADPVRVPAALPGIIVGVGDPLPTDLPQPLPAPEYVFIDVHTGAAVIDLSAWAPTGLLVNQRVLIRKVDAAPGAFGYTCPHSGINYRFVDKLGEFITLLWCGSTFRII